MRRPPTLLSRCFCSPIDGRMRAGWRLLLHGLLTLALWIPLSIPVAALITIDAFTAPEVSPLESPLVLLGSAVAFTLAVLLSTWFARRVLDRRSFRSLGLEIKRSLFSDLLVGFLIAFAVMGCIYAIQAVTGWLTFEGWGWQSISLNEAIAGLLVGLALYVFVGFQEELLCRGYQLQNLIESVNMRWGLLASSSIFALMHLPNPHAGLAAFVGILVSGLFLAYGWIRTRSLWLSIGLHIGWNFFEGTVFGFPVSGLAGFHLILQRADGPPLLTGGAFGPEAGVVLLPGLILGAILIRLYTRRRVPLPSA